MSLSNFFKDLVCREHGYPGYPFVPPSFNPRFYLFSASQPDEGDRLQVRFDRYNREYGSPAHSCQDLYHPLHSQLSIQCQWGTPHFNKSGIISSDLYVQSDAEIKFLEFKPDREEKLITIMEIPGTGVSEDRIATLEKKLQDMDALVKGLIEELLDFKAVARTMARETEERSRQELKRGPVVQDTAPHTLAGPSEGSTVIRPRAVIQPDVPAEPEMVRIMQEDGTMKMEARYGDKSTINSSAGYGRTRKGTSVLSTQDPLIYAAENEKSDPANKK